MDPFLRHRLKTAAQRLGLRARPGGARRDDLGGVARHFRDRGFRPETVIDVGVADGTCELYEAFPAAFQLLIEPMRQFEPQLQAICRRYRGAYRIAASGARTERREIVFGRDLHGASLLDEAEDPFPEHTRHDEVDVVRLDEVVRAAGAAGPYLLKIDVQGAEREVLEGAGGILPETEVVICETSLFAFKRGQPLLAEMIAWMGGLGYAVYDIFGGHTRPLDGALAQVDIAFVKEGGRFRTSHAYITREQEERAKRRLGARLRRLIRA